MAYNLPFFDHSIVGNVDKLFVTNTVLNPSLGSLTYNGLVKPVNTVLLPVKFVGSIVELVVRVVCSIFLSFLLLSKATAPIYHREFSWTTPRSGLRDTLAFLKFLIPRTFTIVGNDLRNTQIAGLPLDLLDRAEANAKSLFCPLSIEDQQTLQETLNQNSLFCSFEGRTLRSTGPTIDRVKGLVYCSDGSWNTLTNLNITPDDTLRANYNIIHWLKSVGISVIGIQGMELSQTPPYNPDEVELLTLAEAPAGMSEVGDDSDLAFLRGEEILFYPRYNLPPGQVLTQHDVGGMIYKDNETGKWMEITSMSFTAQEIETRPAVMAWLRGIGIEIQPVQLDPVVLE